MAEKDISLNDSTATKVQAVDEDSHSVEEWLDAASAFGEKSYVLAGAAVHKGWSKSEVVSRAAMQEAIDSFLSSKV